MPLSVNEVLKKQFVRLYDAKGGLLPPDSKEYSKRRKCSYDLSPRWILKDGTKYDLDSPEQAAAIRKLRFPPQGSLTIVSRERIVLPETHVAYAFLRTTLARLGLLAINTGIVDCGWDNHLATILINFGRDELNVDDIRNQTFLRLTFHEVEGGGGEKLKNREPEEYLEDRRDESRKFPATFLDIPSRMREIRDEVVNTAWSRLGMLVAGVSVALLLVSAAAPALVNWASGARNANPPTETQLAELRERVARLEGRLQAQQMPGQGLIGGPASPGARATTAKPTGDSTASTRRP